MRKHLFWFGSVAIITVIFGTIYTVSQQVLRMDANDPQIQLAEDIARQLNLGTTPDEAVGKKVDVYRSLAPALIIYDKTGNIVAGSALIDNKVPTIPFGVLKSSDSHIYHTVTWRPTKDVRLASATVASNRYYVTAVRSLVEVENREFNVLRLAVFGWLVLIICLAIVYKLHEPVTKSPKKSA